MIFCRIVFRTALSFFFIFFVFFFRLSFVYSAPLFARDFLHDYQIYLKRNESSRTRQSLEKIELQWASPFYHLPSSFFPSPRLFDPKLNLYEKTILRRSQSLYLAALKALKKTLKKTKKNQKKTSSLLYPLPSRFKPTLTGQSKRKEKAFFLKQHQIAANYSLEACRTLYEIKSQEIIDTSFFQELRKSSCRLYSVASIQLKQYVSSLQILKDYLQLDGTEQEWPLHYYLSVCYSHIYRAEKKNRSIGDDHLRRTRRRKNIHYLRAVALKFGSGSKEYKESLNQIHLDELGPPR